MHSRPFCYDKKGKEGETGRHTPDFIPRYAEAGISFFLAQTSSFYKAAMNTCIGLHCILATSVETQELLLWGNTTRTVSSEEKSVS